MTIKKNLSVRVMLAACFCLATLASAQSPKPGELERAVPQDCVAFAKIANMQDLMKAYSSLKGSKLFTDPAMKPFMDPIMEEWRKVVASASEKSGLNLSEMCSYVTGPVSIAMRLDPDNPSEPPFMFMFVECHGKEAEVKSVLAKIEQEAEKNGGSKKTEGGFIVLRGQAEKPRAQFCYSIDKGVLAMGNDPERLAEVQKAYAGAGIGSSLASNERFQEFRSAAGGAGDIEFFVDLNKAMAAGKQGDNAAQMEMVSTMLNLDAFQSVGAAINVGKGEFESETKFMLLSKGQSKVFDLFNMPAKAMEPEAFVPDSVASYFSMNWDIDKFYATLSDIANAAAPGTMERVEQQAAGDADNPLVNIKKDVIGALGNRISVVQEMDGAKARQCYAWEMRNSKAFDDMIKRVLEKFAGAIQLETKTINGNTVYTYDAGAQLAAALPNPDQNPFGVVGLTITKNHMFLATHVEVLEKILNKTTSPLAESADYKKIAAKFPQANSSISYTNGPASVAALWTMIKSGQLTTMLEQGTERFGEFGDQMQGMVKAIDGSKLPELSAVKDYFKSQGSYIIQDERGMRATMFQLKE